MNKTTINRYYLYKYASEHIEYHVEMFHNIEFIRSLFFDSATLIAGMETVWRMILTKDFLILKNFSKKT